MGSLQYDGVIIQFDDRLLTHLQIVIVHAEAAAVHRTAGPSYTKVDTE